MSHFCSLSRDSQKKVEVRTKGGFLCPNREGSSPRVQNPLRSKRPAWGTGIVQAAYTMSYTQSGFPEEAAS